MRKLYLLILFVFGFQFVFSQTKSLKGTWINLAYQDVRNKYTNPIHVDYTSPDFWSTKIEEFAEMGMEYLIIMAVANEQHAYYPSDFMPLAYNKSRLSPVEAIMNTADRLGLKVFMSCGWAINQYDNHHMPEVPILHRRIMDETAAKFGKHKSFYGWYLPIEDGLFPSLSDQAINVANSLTAYGKKLLPHTKVLISPYGLWMAEVFTDKFAEQIRKLKVDIVAYQDEVGCVREPVPIKRVKENFKRLGEIHKGTDISFWANVESFTWEKGTNSIESALVPASFARLLSQMVGATQSGASQLVTFSTQGMFDKPKSEMPLGQPIESTKAFTDYKDWEAKTGRWKWLEATFFNNISYEVIKADVINQSNRTKKSFLSLPVVDGKFGHEDPKDLNWTAFSNGKMEVLLDLRNVKKVNTVLARFLHYRKDSITLPNILSIYSSNDGKNFTKIRSTVLEVSKNDLHDCWIDIAVIENLDIQSKYIKIEAEGDVESKILCDEILVNPKIN